MLAESGYTCLHIDLRLPHGPVRKSDQLLAAFEASERYIL